MKIVRYVVKHDVGLAPNPFHEWCTLAVCTPNHQRARIETGDWIVGNSDRNDGRKLIYAMRVEKVMSMNEYFHAPEFEAKKPKPYGNMVEQRGDNFYFKDEQTRLWRRLPSMFHNKPSFFFVDLGEDLDGREVFAGQEFYYFGENRIAFPQEFSHLIADGRGVRTYGRRDRAEKIDLLYPDFVGWLQRQYPANRAGQLGRRLGDPRDFTDTPVREPMVMSYSFVYDEPGLNVSGQQRAGGCNPNVRPTHAGEVLSAIGKPAAIANAASANNGEKK